MSRGLVTVLLLGALALAGTRLAGAVGVALLYPALGVFPGLAVATLIAWKEPRGTRWLVGLALSPLVASASGWALVAAGAPLAGAAWGVAAASWALWLALETLPARRRLDEDLRGVDGEPGAVRALALGLAAAVAVPPLFNLFIRIYSDGWIHASLVWEIAVRGLPPQDPRFAGMPLNYVWFYNLYLAMLARLAAHDPFLLMIALNVVNLAVLVRLAARLAGALWESPRAATGGALLAAFGLNAGAWLLWPLILLRALRGEVRGLPEVRRILADTSLGDARVLYSLSAPFAHMVSFLDKFLLGTALNTAWVLFVLWLWALADWVRTSRRTRLVWAGAAMCGLWLFHLVPGYAILPVGLATLALAMLLRRGLPWLPPSRALAAFAAASLTGSALTAPYALSVTLGWQAGTSGVANSYFHPGPIMPWTLLTACGVTLWFARRPLATLLTGRRAAATLIALFAVLMAVFASVIHLPENNESKFVPLVFLPLAALAGGAFLDEAAEWRRRLGRVRAGVALALLFAVPTAATLAGYLIDPRGRDSEALHPKPGEQRLYAWMRDSTDAKAVFVDHRHRDLVMVLGRRRLYYGSTFGSERAAFPREQVVERRAVMDDLYGPGADLDRDARALSGLGGPAYVIFRPGDFGTARPWERLEERRDRFAPAWSGDDFRVYEVIG